MFTVLLNKITKVWTWDIALYAFVGGLSASFLASTMIISQATFEDFCVDTVIGMFSVGLVILILRFVLEIIWPINL